MSADVSRKWSHQRGDRYLPIACSAWMNETGHGFNYRVLEQDSGHERAIARGLAQQGSDDFNIGVIRNDRLVALLWMREVVDDDVAVLAEVAEQIGLAA